MPKVSRYNHFQPWGDAGHIAYNARSGAVALMTPDDYATYERIAEAITSDRDLQFSPAEQELLEQLQYGGFVCPDDRDEREALKFLHNMARYEQASLGLVVAPTLACNMACDYCYEANKKGRMSAGLVGAIAEFVEKRAAGLELLDVGWYGGEPLLAMDIVEDLTKAMRDLGEEYRFSYTSSMVSNGYLLTRETVDRLLDLRISSVQVTLDGPARIHDAKRPLKDGRGSFDTIIENIAYAAGKMGVGIRVNVDKSFSGEVIREMLEELRAAGLRDRVGIYFGQLEPHATVCSNIAEACYGTADFSRVETEYHRLLLEGGFAIQKIPSPTSTVCLAQNVSAFLVDPGGYLYKCFNFVGDPSKSFGTIREAIDYQDPNFTSLFAFDPFEDEACRECDILPLCMGGCPARRAVAGLAAGELCDGWKHNLRPMLELIARSKQLRASSAAGGPA